MKTRIINVLAHKPDYDFMHDKPRPAVNWDTSDGKWVGIYGNEITNKLGEQVLKYSDAFEYEVWQPDYRADKMYSHRFESGLVHRLFPAKDRWHFHGIKVRREIYSQALVDYLLKYSKEHRVIINLNGDFCELNFKILEKCGHLPVLQTFRGLLYLPWSQVFKTRLNVLASLSYYQKHLRLKKLARRIDHIMVMNDFYLDDLKNVYPGPILKLTSGCDFDKWLPMDRSEARAALDLPQDKTIFFSSSLLIPIKQLDKLIRVLSRLRSEHDFLLLVSGHGLPDYETYLKNEAAELLKEDKIRFVGYITGEKLRQHYCAADAFVHPSISEGGPGAAMKAIACGVPVIITRVSNVAEHMQENGSGKIIDPFDYAQWQTVFEQILKGEQLKPFPREQGRELYDWQAVAEKFTEIYHYLEKGYEKRLQASDKLEAR